MRVRGYPEEQIGFRDPYITSWVKILMIYYGAIFALETVLYLSSKETFAQMMSALSFVPEKVWNDPLREGYRFFTFLIPHEFHALSLLLNLLSLLFIGKFLEEAVGTKSFLGIFFFSSAIAALGFLLITPSSTHSLLGPGASCLGLFACTAILFANRLVPFFSTMIPLWGLATAIILFLVVFTVFVEGNRDWPPLLGLVGGALYAWNLKQVIPWTARLGIGKLPEKWKESREKRSRDRDQADRAEMDRILEKIGRSGIGSLTNTEKRFLDKTSQRLRESDH